MLLRLLRAALKPRKDAAAVPAFHDVERAGTPDELLLHGKQFEKKGELEAALECYRAAAANAFNPVRAQIDAANVLVDLWRLDEAIEAYRQAVAMEPQSTRILSGLLFFSHLASSPLDRAALFELHRDYGKRVLALAREPMHQTVPRDPRKRRLRIGYVSPNFSRHSVGYFIEPVIAHHDREAVEVFCYYTERAADETTHRIAAHATVWRQVHEEDDETLARLICADGIDILVDLSGHTAGNRLGVFARKPAPVQMTWLGYADTTGMAAIDYRITDAMSDPVPHAESFHTERLLRLNDVFLCYRPAEEAPPVTARSEGAVVFGSFNALEKVNEQTISVWARILEAIPDARLLVKAKLLQFRDTERRFRQALERHGIAPERLALHAWSPDRSHHLGLYGEVDIALDTFPYNGTTTTCEALWMGVPVITLPGDRHMARVGATLLNAAGLPELIAPHAEGYVAAAVALARDSARRRVLRAGMRERLEASVLLDHGRFVRDLESALRRVWDERWAEGAPARPGSN